MSPVLMDLNVDKDIFDLDFQVSATVVDRPVMAYTEDCTKFECGPTGTCWSSSCTGCCASSDWRTGC